MASAAPNTGLPIMYRELQPLSSVQHGELRLRQIELFGPEVNAIKGTTVINGYEGAK